MISAKGEPNDPEAERPNSIIDIESARSKGFGRFYAQAVDLFIFACYALIMPTGVHFPPSRADWRY